GVMRAANCPQEISRLITAKAEGNPFYIEEVTKALVETGAIRRENGGFRLARPIENIHIPETIQEVILTRIDRLDHDARDAIQLASVIGREFAARLLARIAEAHTQLDGQLSALKSLELIYEKAYFPELSYMFKHALTHDVAYSTLLNERRRALHRLVGAAIEELYSDRLNEHYETLAHHYEEGEDWDKALDYLRKAGEKAAGAFANQQAIAFYQRALDVCERVGPAADLAAAEIARQDGTLRTAIGDIMTAIGSFERSLASARRAEEPRAIASALVGRGLAELFAHEFERCEETFDEAIEACTDQLPDVRAAAESLLASKYLIMGDLERASSLVSRGDEIANEISEGLYRGFWIELLAFERSWRGAYADAVAVTDDPADDVPVTLEVGIAWGRGVALAGNGLYNEALVVLFAALALTERIGEAIYRARILNTIGWVYGELQDFERAAPLNERSAEAALAIDAPDPEIECNCWLNLTDYAIANENYDEAAELLGRVERVVRDPQPPERWALWLYSQHFLHTMGELELARGNVETAATLARECIGRAESTGRRKNAVKGHRLLAQTCTAQGRLDEADAELASALATAREIGNPPQLWKTLAAVGQLRVAQGRLQDAAQAYGEALAVIERVATELTDEELRQSLRGSAMVASYRAGLAIASA
ncbi:MAG TPA: tetratricopeptide repeat protein, partial [Dehalococcoidia bacterium]